jgi:hypothetical protein
MTQFVQPPNLRTFLHYGGDPRATLGESGFRLLLEVHRIALTTPENERLRRAADYRYSVTCAVNGEAEHFCFADDPERVEEALRPRDQDQVTLQAWEADLLEDPTLGERVCGFLDPIAHAEHEMEIEKFRSPHPLSVEVGGPSWTCDNCGEHQPLLAEVGEYGGWEMLQYPIHYCEACLRETLTKMESAKLAR